jgi:U3 small nucleolar RNA-associated protein 21
MNFVTNGDYKINHIYSFADTLILTTDEKNVLRLWSKKLELQSLIDFQDKTITSMLHPSTYINKLLVGTREGHLELWNLHSKKLIFEFKQFLGTPITCLAEAPAIDVVGIGKKHF